MKTLLVLCAVLFSASVVFASPFVVSESYTAPAVIPDYFKVSSDGGAETQSPLWSGTMVDGTVLVNAFHFDVGSVTVGSHAVQVKACKAATMWDPEACSAAPPFAFSRPAPPSTPATPTGITLKR